MSDMNFIPSYRIMAGRRRALIRRWATASVVWAIVLVTLYAVAYATWGGGRVAIAGEQRRVAARVQESSQAIKVLQHELTATNLLLRSSQIVESQPDWSLLLALLPRALSGDVVLKRCEVRAVPPVSLPPAASGGAGAAQTASSRAAPAATAAEPTFILKISGCGRSMPAVLQFVQELERMGLFDQVRLVHTNPEVVQTLSVTGFQVECSLSGSQEIAR